MVHTKYNTRHCHPPVQRCRWYAAKPLTPVYGKLTFPNDGTIESDRSAHAHASLASASAAAALANPHRQSTRRAARPESGDRVRHVLAAALFDQSGQPHAGSCGAQCRRSGIGKQPTTCRCQHHSIGKAQRGLRPGAGLPGVSAVQLQIPA